MLGTSSNSFDDSLLLYSNPTSDLSISNFTSAPILSAIRRAGTELIYTDSADVDDIYSLSSAAGGIFPIEVNGNTTNQHFILNIINRYLDPQYLKNLLHSLNQLYHNLSARELIVLVYTIVCGRIGNSIAQLVAGKRQWEISIPLHLELCGDIENAQRFAQLLRRMVPTAIVKVCFTPQYPQCLLIARDLERSGVPVNVTCTFSARQITAAAILSNVTRANIFMGRINRAFSADLLGEHICLTSQKYLNTYRRDWGIKTRLIVASVKDWQTFIRVAGCDAITAPCETIRNLMSQGQIQPDSIHSRIEISYEDRLGIASKVLNKVSLKRLARLYQIEEEYVEFLTELSNSVAYQTLSDPGRLFRYFDNAGFGDLFYSPTETEWSECRKDRLPSLDAPITESIPFDTLLSILGFADFQKSQNQLDTEIQERIKYSCS